MNKKKLNQEKLNNKINIILFKNLKYNNAEEIIINNNSFITELTLYNNNSRINIYFNKNKYFININIGGNQDFNLINNNNSEIIILLKAWLKIININQDILYNK